MSNSQPVYRAAASASVSEIVSPAGLVDIVVVLLSGIIVGLILTVIS